MIILTESYVNEMENPVAKYKAKKAAEAKAAEDAEVERQLGKRPTVGKYVDKYAGYGGALSSAGYIIKRSRGERYDNYPLHALASIAAGAGAGKVREKYQEHKQKKYDKKAEAIRASMRNKQ